MGIDLVFVVMLVGHMLGDFYLQTDKLVKERKERYAAVVKHGVLYAIVAAAVMALGLPITGSSILLWAGVGFSHFLIDSSKYLYEKYTKELLPWVRKHLLIVDQCIHFAAFSACWAIWGRGLAVRWFVAQEMNHLPALPVTLLLAVLCILRPIGIMIAESDLRHYRKTEAQDGAFKNSGRVIGYFERLIVFIFLLYQQFGAIAFVLTAKSVARFKEIEKDQSLAEYYLIGTLMSVGSAIIITVLLGLV